MPLQNLSHPDALIIIFAREPVYGQVKTRLIPALGEKGATEFYSKLLAYTINNVITAVLSPVNLCITPESHISYFAEMPCADQFEISLQAGDDLGMRMYHALASGLKQYSKVILIGTDCPFLKKTDLQQAISALDENDMVFSPAKDGGYVLVGAKKVLPDIFTDIEWGTDKVMEQSRKALTVNDFCWQELSEQQDVDIESDLRYLTLHDDFKDYFKI